MKNRIVQILACIALVIMIAGCGNSVGNSPEQVAVDYFKALYSEDINKIKSLCYTNDSQAEYDEASMIEFLKSISQEAEKQGGVNSVEAEEAELNEAGDKANVRVKIITGNGEKSVMKCTTVKKEGKWYFDAIDLF